MGTKRKGYMTLAEHHAQIKAEGKWEEYVARKQKQEEERQKKAVEWRRAEAPLVQELQAAGFHVRTVWDLVNTSVPYQEALPILVKHLQLPYPERVREGIARALAVKPAIEHWDILSRLFEIESDVTTTGVKWGLGCALSAAATDDVIDDVIRLVRNPQHGGNRLALLDALARSTTPQAQKTLAELGTDPELATAIQSVLKRHRGRSGSKRKRRE